MATGSGDPDADAGMGIGVGAGGYGGDGTGSPGYGGGAEQGNAFGGLIGKYSKRANPLGALWEGIKSFGLGPLGAIANGIRSSADYEKAATKARADLKAQGKTDAEIAALEKDYLGSLGLGEGAPAGTQGANQDAAVNEFGKLIEQEAAAASPSLVDQFGALFQGVDAPFNIQDMLTKNQQNIEEADKKYSDMSATIMDKWNQFEQNFDKYYGAMSSQYDSLNPDYDANTRDYSSIYGRQQGLENQYNDLYTGYQDKARSIPQLNLTLPGGMGGGSFSLAPSKWNDVYSTQAKTSSDILSGKGQSLVDQRGTIDSRLQNTNAKRTAFDSKADLLYPWATQQSNAISNQATTAQNDYNTRMKSLEALMEPFRLGYDIYDRDKQLAARQALQDSAISATEPNDFDRWAPIAAAAMPSIINIGKDLFGGLIGGGSSGIGSAIGGGLSW